jgi:3-hydroxyacyl-CoA dehydrogenase/enoyl-CoA hydratase/3-hydroxybutyryl-CoA epimerase
MQTIRYEIADGVATLTFDQPDSAVNTMSLAWQQDLGEAVERLAADKASLKGVVLQSAKPTFFAGADLKALMRLREDDAVPVFAAIERMKRNFRLLETLGLPVVACLNGSALGGGWEVALAAHHRIAVDDGQARFGLPEVTLGLIPGGSGITKMTRLLGLMAAQPYLVEGRTFSAREAQRLGLIHELVPDAAALRQRALAWIAEHPQARQPWDEKGHKIPGGTPSHPALAAALAVAPAMLRKTTRGLYPAPEAALCAMVEGAQVDFDTALRIESRYLARLMVGTQARAMVSAFFFDLHAIKSARARPAGMERSKPNRIGVLGAGMMGAGIAWANASHGIPTVLKDVSLAKAEAGKARSARLAETRVAKGRMTMTEQVALLERIHPTARNGDLEGCDLIIEAVFEDRALKAEVTKAAQGMLAPTGFFASNTSTLPISGLADVSARPEKFIGIHFFSPVDKMKLVEIIRGARTDEETVARACDYVLAIGKLPIVVNDSRGFFTSRVFGTFVMEGAAMLGEGIPAAVIENAGRQAGMPVGPLAVHDETSLALSVQVLDQARADARAEGRSHAAGAGELLVERMVKEHRRLGRAAGGGFYDYPAGAPKTLWPQLKALFGKPGTAWDIEELKDRLLWRQAIETARCLHEGVLNTVHEANIGSIFGIGFPAWTGGALQFIYGMGVERFAERAMSLAERHGAGYAMAPGLLETLRQRQPRY